MKLIESARTPNSRRVRIFLAEKGIAVPTEQVDLGALQHKTTEFSALNPLQRVPVLRLDDGSVLTESIAICRYFEVLHPEPPLMGGDALEMARIEMWQRRMEMNLLWAVMHAFRHSHPNMAQLEVPQVPAWGEANRPRVLEMLGFLDRELAARPFIAGDDYTVADITALVASDFLKPARIERPLMLQSLSRWYDTVSSRPSARA
jgi:glutathione S-transferase